MHVISDSTRLTFAKSSQLPTLVETDKLRLEEMKTQLNTDYRKREKQFKAYYQVSKCVAWQQICPKMIYSTTKNSNKLSSQPNPKV